MKAYECEGQMSLGDVLGIVWKRYPGATKGMCPVCGEVICYDATHKDRPMEEIWASRNPFECSKCGMKFSKDTKMPKDLPVLSGLTDEPIEKKTKIGESVKTHGKRVWFDDIKEGQCYLVDNSSYYAKSYKKVYVKQIEGDKVMYVDNPRGVNADWSWGNSFSAMTRAEYIDAEENYDKGKANTLGWWFEEGEETDENKIEEPSEKSSGSSTGNEIIDHLLADLRKEFPDKELEDIEYTVWEHVKKLGKRLYVVVPAVDVYDLQKLVTIYESMNLEVSILNMPTTVTGKYYAAYGGEYIKKIFDKYVAAA